VTHISGVLKDALDVMGSEVTNGYHEVLLAPHVESIRKSVKGRNTSLQAIACNQATVRLLSPLEIPVSR
jgi:hypothetical protein